MTTELLNPANYAFTPYAIPTFVTSLALLLLGLTVLIRERLSLVSVLFFLMTLTVSVWLFGFSWMYSTTNEGVARWWAKAAYLGVPFIPSAIYHFTVVALRIYQRHKARVWISWTISALFAAVTLGTDALHSAMYRYPWGYYPKYGWLGLPFVTFFFCIMLIVLHHYWMEYRKAKPGTHKSRIKWLSIAFAGASIASLDFLPKYGVPLYPFGYLGIFAWLVFVERAIWRYQLVDITPAFAAEPIIRTMADALLVLDHDGILQVTNQAACHLLGRSETELVGKSITTISRDLFPKEKLDRLIRTGALQSYETTHSPREGWTVVLDISASAIRDRFEQTVGIVCIARDITERRSLHSGLRKRWRGSIRLRHTVGLSVIILLIMGIGSTVMIYEQGKTIRKAAEVRGLAFSRSFALIGAAAVLDNLFRIQEAMNQYLHSDILQLEVIDPDNMIVAAKDPKRIGTVLSDQDWLTKMKTQTEFLTYSQDAYGEPTLVIVEPLFDNPSAAFKDGKIAAWVRVVFSLTHVRHEEWQAMKRMVLVTLALMAAGIIGLQFAQRQVSNIFRNIIGQLQGALSTLGMSQRAGPASAAHAVEISQTAAPGQGELEYLTEAVTQTTELVKIQSEALRESEMKFRSVAHSASDAIISVDWSGNVISWNKGAKNIFGYGEEEMLSKPITLLIPERYRGDHLRELERMRSTGESHVMGKTLELAGLRKDGTEFPLELSLATWKTGEGTFYTGIIRDITERKQAEARLAELAYYDFLTGLPNRRQFMELLDQALGRARRIGKLLAILFLDLDGFKLVNDSLGHPMGDLVLKTMATRLTGCVRKSDSVARMGGDEFMFILEKISSPSDASAVAQKLLETVALPLGLEGHDIFMTASIGIVIFPSDDQDRDDLIQHADTAMYTAKARSNSFQFYSADMNVRAAERLQLETDLRRAVEREEFVPHYQPLIDARSGNICGVEALTRWQHPHRGLLSPDSFISVAEETGLIVPITELVLRAACVQTKAWQVGGFPDLRVAANISGRLFQYHNLSDMIVQILHETGLEPHSLEVELTESLFIQDRERSIATLRKLRDVGVRIAIDDFGVEYSSLGYLKHLPITTLKIDQSFVRDLPTNPADVAIIQAIISLASCLDLTVIAEGVETNAQAEFLRSRLCDELQGYYFSRPLPANLLTPLLGHSIFRPARSRITLGSPKGR